MEKFTDRRHAGRVLAEALKHHTGKENTIILALPRGGVPVAFEISQALTAPLDVYIVRKLGVPGEEELAMGALAMDGTIILNHDIIENFGITKSVIETVIHTEEKELTRRNKVYRANKPLPKLKNKIIILVDDGIATGATIRAAISALQHQTPKRLIVAVPVSAIDPYDDISTRVDELVCPLLPKVFYGVGTWYKNFSQTNDAEVLALLKQANKFNL